ncbi:MAG: hypothetical protein V3W08_08540 [Candidatus Binatia bacterium]
MALRKLRNMKNPFEYGGVVSGNAFWVVWVMSDLRNLSIDAARKKFSALIFG